MLIEKTDADENRAYAVHLSPAECRIDLGDGSERGEYVSQDYILRRLGKPVHAINLMYCYYPKDKAWPQRASKAYADKEITFAWDYPYDDYFPYLGGLNGSRDGEPFTCIRDVRRHGQDVVFTLTMDPTLSDEEIAAIARDLRPFGRLQIRINHEATGDWFSFNKRASYPEVARFFARCVDIFHREAEQIKVILCLDGYKELDAEKMEREDDFLPAIKAADIESVDRYMALHWGWPFDLADSDTNQYARYRVKSIYELAKKSAARYNELSGRKKPMVLSELNADGDVVGPYDQADMVKEFGELLKADEDRWLDGFTLYQFRDRGRLGLELEDPNDPGVGVAWPLMDTFIEMIHDPFFSAKIEKGLSAGSKERLVGEEAAVPKTLRWGGSEDADGIGLPVRFDGAPVFLEAYFDDDCKELALMLEIGGVWFYKAPGVTSVDLMPAFFDKNSAASAAAKKDPSGFELSVNIFAPPADGENAVLGPDDVKGFKLGEKDYLTNAFVEIPSLPKIRVRTKPIILSDQV